MRKQRTITNLIRLRIMPMLRAALLTLVWAVGLNQATAQSRREDVAVQLGWRSTAGSEEALASDIAELFLALYNTDNLAVRSVENPDGIFVEQLMRKEGVFSGAHFPRSLDNLLCDLNPHVCSRDRTPVVEGLSDVATHVGGYSFSEPRWAFMPGSKFTLPDYKFERFTTIKRMAVPSGWSPDDYRPDADVSCTTWEIECAELVRSLNTQLLKAPEKGEATAVLPVSGLETRIQLKPDALTKYSETMERLGSQQENQGTSVTAPDVIDFSATWSQTLSKKSATDVMLNAIEDNILAIGSGSTFSVEDEPLFGEQVDLFKLIVHPFRRGGDVHDIYKHPVKVLVLDEELDPSHCDFPPGETNGTAAPDGASCTEVNAAHPLHDHSAHIYGMLAAPMNGRGIVGLNPSAQVTFGAVNTQIEAEQDLIEASNHLVSAAVRKVRIANLSWGFDRSLGGADYLEQSILGLDESMLIVAAAGNHNRSLGDNNCGIFPACMHEFDNVITVIGLDRNEAEPALWRRNDAQGSNWSPSFHIAAIADNVLSTIRAGKLGHLSGTSQAAPQVTAAASMIYSAAELIYADAIAENGERLAPRYVKDRLIYTADLFLGLGNKVQSGRLNIDRAIEIVDTQLELERDGVVITVKGRVVQIPNDVILCNRLGSPEDVAHNWDSIRRLYYEPVRKRYVIFKHENVNDRFSTLERIDGCNLTSRSHVGKLVKDDNVEFEFLLSEIRDYTSPLLE
ncbi:S8 family peptidase [Mesorhizobium sp. f-mel]